MRAPKSPIPLLNNLDALDFRRARRSDSYNASDKGARPGQALAATTAVVSLARFQWKFAVPVSTLCRLRYGKLSSGTG